MSLYVKPNGNFNGLSFVHIPKNGGTSIREAIRCHFQEDVIEVIYENHVHSKIDKLPSYFSFAVLRDPYQRAVSFYNEMYHAIKANRLDLSITMDDYNKGFNYYMENYFIKKFGNPGVEPSISPSDTQLSYITKDNKIAVDLLLNFDNLKNEWYKIENYIGAEIKLPRWNVGKMKITDVTMSKNSLELIEHYYADDFKLLTSMQ